MAIVLENFVSSNSGGSTVTSLSHTAPSGITSGELLVIITGSDDSQSGAEFSINSGTYPGWTKLGEASGGVADAHLGLFYKTAGGSEGNVTVDAASNDEMLGWYMRFSGVDTSAPFDTYGFNDQSAGVMYAAAAGSSPDDRNTVPSIDNGFELFAIVCDGGDTAPFTENFDFTIHSRATVAGAETTSGTTGNDVAGTFATGQQTTAAAVGGVYWDGTVVDGAAGFYAVMTPAAAAGSLVWQPNRLINNFLVR